MGGVRRIVDIRHTSRLRWIGWHWRPRIYEGCHGVTTRLFVWLCIAVEFEPNETETRQK